MNYKNITIIIPTFNEEKNIGKLLEKINDLYKDVFVIVSDDNSLDKTQSIVKEWSSKNKRIILLDRSDKLVKGLTTSVIDAILMTKTKYFIVMDGDMQHPPEKIKEINKFIENNDLVVGIRENVFVHWPLNRRLMSLIATKLGEIRLLICGNPMCSDIMSGFFGAKTKKIHNTIIKHHRKFELKGYKILFDYLKLLPRNTKIKEINYDFGSRYYGDSKISLKHVLFYLRSLLR